MATNTLNPITPEETLNPPKIDQPPVQDGANAVVASQIPAPAVPADTYRAPDTSPVSSQVAAEGETVESRINAMTAEGSRYTDLAKSDTIRQANSRGLINSTMAGAAGTEAAIRAALPIAQQDAKTMTDTRMLNQNTENEFLKNRQSADLNMETAAHTSRLAQIETVLDYDQKARLEILLQSEKFSDEAKMNIVTTMSNIVRDTQTQITEIGLSDRSAAQQASAIEMVYENRDAELAVYEALLDSFSDWDWGTNFTPGQVEAETSLEPKPTAPPPEPTGEFGSILQTVAAQTSPDGDWVWDSQRGEWVLNPTTPN